MTEEKAPSSADRLVFFDNLRYLMILLVLVFHSGASYGSMVAFWPYHDPKPTEFVDIMMLLFDVFMMSVLFFIAGYFALPSLKKQVGLGFLKAKLTRLGIPWLVVTLFVLPLLDYLHYYTHLAGNGASLRSYGAHWWLSIKKIAEFSIGPMRMSEYLDMTVHFYQRYMWFLSLLLLFLVVFWLLHRAWGTRPRALKEGAAGGTGTSSSVYLALAIVGLLNVALFALARFLFSSPSKPFDMVWFSLGNLVQFESAKLAFYVPYFGLGVYACSRRWFTGGVDLGPPRTWGVACLLLMVVNMLVGRSMSRAADPSIALRTAFVVLYPLWTLSFLGAFAAYASRRWNRVSQLGRKLADSSFNMYLVHYVVPMTLPLGLASWAAGPTLLKFAIVALSTIVLSYWFSRYVLGRFPRLAVAGIVGMNVGLALITS